MAKTEKETNHYHNYKNNCSCAEDDNCGCSYPNNIPENLKEEEHQNICKEVTLKIQTGTKAPNFTSPAILEDNTLLEKYNLYNETRENNIILFFYPEDFCFTCPSELLMLNKEINTFNQKQTKVIGISTDSINSHYTWRELTPERGGISDIQFPLISDFDKKISTSYGFLNQKRTSMRATVIIDKKRIIRHISINDNKIWRNPSEYLRIIEILNQKNG